MLSALSIQLHTHTRLSTRIADFWSVEPLLEALFGLILLVLSVDEGCINCLAVLVVCVYLVGRWRLGSDLFLAYGLTFSLY